MLVVLGAQLVHVLPDTWGVAAPPGGLVDLLLLTVVVQGHAMSAHVSNYSFNIRMSH